MAVLGHARVVEVSAEQWVAAAVLGGLRQACNDALRADHRDRGTTKNTAGDIQGCFGELLVGTLIERELPWAGIEVNPLDWDRPVDDVDATVEIGGHTFLVETKCHLQEPAKRWFLINAVAADRSQARGAKSFVPVFASLGSSIALVGRPLLMSDVLRWPPRDFGYGDPARGTRLAELMPAQFDLTIETAVQRLAEAGATCDPRSLHALAAKARAKFDRLRTAGLPVSSRPSEALATLVTVA